MMGAERKSAVITEESRKLTAYHEGGHAVVACFTDGALPVHKATVVPRGMALGMVCMFVTKSHTLSLTHTNTYVCVCACVYGYRYRYMYVCERERASERASEREREYHTYGDGGGARHLAPPRCVTISFGDGDATF